MNPTSHIKHKTNDSKRRDGRKESFFAQDVADATNDHVSDPHIKIEAWVLDDFRTERKPALRFLHLHQLLLQSRPHLADQQIFVDTGSSTTFLTVALVGATRLFAPSNFKVL